MAMWLNTDDNTIIRKHSYFGIVRIVISVSCFLYLKNIQAFAFRGCFAVGSEPLPDNSLESTEV